MVRYLLLEKGPPYQEGTKISFDKEVIILGRSSNAHQPDISFDNPFISRSHCSVKVSETTVELTDLASKHGTEVNNQPLLPATPVMLKHNDRISLSHGAAVLRLVMLNTLDDETMEIGVTPFTAEHVITMKLDIHKRQCQLGSRVIVLSPKEWNLLFLLHSNQGKMVSLAEVKSAVWPERQLLAGQIPSVGIEEINLLIYRVRQKLGEEGKLIRNIRGLGCMLE